MLTVVFVITLSLLTGFYVKIWIEIRQRRNTEVGVVYGSTRIKHAVKMAKLNSIESKNVTGSPTKSDCPTSPKLSRRASQAHVIKLSRTTIIFFSVTVAFVITYLPGLIVMICRSVIKNFYDDLTPLEEMIVKLFSRFYFINNAINPIIYSFLNSRFRKQCSKTFASIALCCKRAIKSDDLSSHDSSKSYTN